MLYIHFSPGWCISGSVATRRSHSSGPCGVARFGGPKPTTCELARGLLDRVDVGRPHDDAEAHPEGQQVAHDDRPPGGLGVVERPVDPLQHPAIRPARAGAGPPARRAGSCTPQPGSSRRGGDRLGHRGDPEDRVAADRVTADRLRADRVDVRLAAPAEQCDQAGHLALRRGRPGHRACARASPWRIHLDSSPVPPALFPLLEMAALMRPPSPGAAARPSPQTPPRSSRMSDGSMPSSLPDSHERFPAGDAAGVGDLAMMDHRVQGDQERALLRSSGTGVGGADRVLGCVSNNGPGPARSPVSSAANAVTRLNASGNEIPATDPPSEVSGRDRPPFSSTACAINGIGPAHS